MKNLKVSMKLITSFLLVAIFCAAVGVVGIIGMRQINSSAVEMYEMQTVPMPYMAHILENIQMLRVDVREYYIAAANNDNDRIEEVLADVNTVKRDVTGYLNLYSESVIAPEAQALFNDTRSLLNTEYAPHLDRVYEYAKEGNLAAIRDDINAVSGIFNGITSGFATLLEMKVEVAGANAESNVKMADNLLIVIIVVLVLAVAIAIFFAFYISGLISKPLIPLASIMNRAGTTGEIKLSEIERDAISKYSQVRDEIGQTIKSYAGFIKHVEEISDELDILAGGDISASINVLSDKDIIGLSLKKVTDSLNNTFSDINASAGQVSTGSKQVADGAQALAQGSTQQAASVQQLASSISDVANRTKENADLAEQAAKLADTIKSNAERGSRQMDEMIAAVNEINDASGSISKVIKVIDDIAFQTNILALNAAVEAARAGQHGKGFAVVAEEVRNLAAKSAEAAKESSGMIENSIDKAQLGVRIAGETAESLTEIVSGINESNRLVGEIAKSSDEQTTGIDQINIGIDQVAQVVQQNSATAEESAAASEEMSSQSTMLQELISQFKLRGGSAAHGLPEKRKPDQSSYTVAEEKDYSHVDAGGDGFGKY